MAANANAASGTDARDGATATVTTVGLSGVHNCVVHRGDGVRGLPENSLEAALKAWGSGFIPECDVRYTAEKKVIAFHDGAIAGKPLNSYSWEWLKDFDIGSCKGAQWSHVRIPTWDAIFAAMEGRPKWRILADYILFILIFLVFIGTVTVAITVFVSSYLFLLGRKTLSAYSFKCLIDLFEFANNNTVFFPLGFFRCTDTKRCGYVGTDTLDETTGFLEPATEHLGDVPIDAEKFSKNCSTTFKSSAKQRT